MDLLPFDLFDGARLNAHGNEPGALIAAFEMPCLNPPWPLDHRLYGHLLAERLPNLDGDFVEREVLKGGITLFFVRIAHAAGRRVLAFDTFTGIPEPDLDNPYFRAGDYYVRPDQRPLLARLPRTAEGLKDAVEAVPGLLEATLLASSSGPLRRADQINRRLDAPVDAHELIARLIGPSPAEWIQWLQQIVPERYHAVLMSLCPDSIIGSVTLRLWRECRALLQWIA